ncbi:MarR family transcriptional regulator [Cutibacterium acnes P6]|uniref:MarR family winged helix-turn-helix transcriptional regulator n=1 Tax=Cutibacterium acnes TaxID=1747 RepID=UPI0003C52169|nr:MarR family transcriptional regulator [Cutibacterium acnes]ESS87212.1 MarR family transcriptional regulator [Cutibacterium acnes P6]
MDLRSILMHLQCELVAERSLVNPLDISWLQYDVLLQLDREHEMLPSELSLVMGISRTKLSKALKSLKVMGYVRQTASKSDGRELRTSITESGRRLLEDISLQHTSLYETAIRSMTKDELEVFARLSEKLSSSLKQQRIASHA